jgi:Tfp pilus assembly protein PilV
VSRRAVSLVEALVCLLLLALVLVPVIDLAVSSRRASHSAARTIEIALHAQKLLEALARLDVHELPPVPEENEVLILADGVPLKRAGGDRFREVERLFEQQPPLAARRKVAAQRLATGEMLLRLDVDWTSVAGEERTRQRASFRMLASPGSWTRP